MTDELTMHPTTPSVFRRFCPGTLVTISRGIFDASIAYDISTTEEPIVIDPREIGIVITEPEGACKLLSRMHNRNFSTNEWCDWHVVVFHGVPYWIHGYDIITLKGRCL